ncbi:hypothetical protein HPP92_006965 [Vanilla planifolia]|uniref:Uncharacterized protein n=1 Tax=Vanilla planifolia TaxID=51239 RepID=A0A835V967_VANPL|nr:hypothetical protein HPP92_006965 [Vanilla planifolia]
MAAVVDSRIGGVVKVGVKLQHLSHNLSGSRSISMPRRWEEKYGICHSSFRSSLCRSKIKARDEERRVDHPSFEIQAGAGAGCFIESEGKTYVWKCANKGFTSSHESSSAIPWSSANSPKKVPQRS